MAAVFCCVLGLCWSGFVSAGWGLAACGEGRSGWPSRSGRCPVVCSRVGVDGSVCGIVADLKPGRACPPLNNAAGSGTDNRMDYFAYQGGVLHCEQVPVERIAHELGTPTYVYSSATFRLHFRRLAEAFAVLSPLICYSIKSCQNVHICRLLADLGAGFDVVSGGELHRALLAGADPAKIVFAGVGKTEREIDEARRAAEAEARLEHELKYIELAKKLDVMIPEVARLAADALEAIHKAYPKAGAPWTAPEGFANALLKSLGFAIVRELRDRGQTGLAALVQVQCGTFASPPSKPLSESFVSEMALARLRKRGQKRGGDRDEVPAGQPA